MSPRESKVQWPSDDSDNHEVILMIGKTGSGKSSSGNTILGREEFKTSDGGKSETTSAKAACCEINNVKIKVVDGPGTLDTRTTETDDLKQFMAEMKNSFRQCVNGFRALVLVLKFGDRFTVGERKTVQILKKTFGSNFMRDHCILIFTHGDSFDKHSKKYNKSFKTWCDEQTDDLKEIILECQNRVVLFRNMDGMEANNEARHTLLNLMRQIPNPYTDEMFAELKYERDKAILVSLAPAYNKEKSNQINILYKTLNQEQEDVEKLSTIGSIRKDANDLKKEIEDFDRGMAVLDDLKEEIQTLLNLLDGNEREVRKHKEEIEKKDGEREAARKKAEEEETKRKEEEAEKERERATRIQAEKKCEEILKRAKEVEESDKYLLKEAEVKYTQLQCDMTKMEGDFKVEITKLINARDNLKKEKNGLEIQRDSFKTERDGLKTERDSLKTERDSLKTERDSLKTERNSLKTERNSLKTERDSLKTERNTLETERNTLETERDSLKTERNTLKREKGDLETQRDNFKTQRDTLKNERDTLKNERDTLKNERDTLKKERDTLKKEKGALETVRDTLEKEKGALEKEKGALEKKRYENSLGWRIPAGILTLGASEVIRAASTNDR